MIKKLKFKLNSDNNLREILSGSVSAFLLKISGMLVGYMVILLISREYGASGVGMYSLSLSIIGFLSIASAMGMNMSILRYFGQFRDDQSNQKLLYKFVLEVSLPIAILSSIVLYISSEFIAENFFHDVMYKHILEIASFCIPFFALTELNIEYIRGLKNIKISEYLRSVSKPLVNLILLFSLSSYISTKYLPMYTFAIAVSITCVISVYFIFNKLLPFSIKTERNFTKKELLFTSTPMLVTALSSFIIGESALFFLQIFSTATDVGIFSVSLKISILISLVLIVVNTITATKFSELYWSNRHDALQLIINQSSKIIFITSLLIGLLIIIFNQYILGIFGDEFIIGSKTLILLTIGQVANAVTGSVGVFLNMTGNQKVLRNTIFIIMLINLFLCYILIPNFGIEGAAFVTMVSSIFSNIFLAYYIKTKLGFRTYFIPFQSRRICE